MSEATIKPSAGTSTPEDAAVTPEAATVALFIEHLEKRRDRHVRFTQLTGTGALLVTVIATWVSAPLVFNALLLFAGVGTVVGAYGLFLSRKDDIQLAKARGSRLGLRLR